MSEKVYKIVFSEIPEKLSSTIDELEFDFEDKSDVEDFLFMCFERLRVPFMIVDNLENLVLKVHNTTITIYGMRYIKHNFVEMDNCYRVYCYSCKDFNNIIGLKIFDKEGFEYKCSCGEINKYLIWEDEDYIFPIKAEKNIADLTKKMAVNMYSIEYKVSKLVNKFFSDLLGEDLNYFSYVKMDSLYCNMLDIDISLYYKDKDSHIELEYRFNMKDDNYEFELLNISLNVNDMKYHSIMFEKYKKIVEAEEEFEKYILNIVDTYLED